MPRSTRKEVWLAGAIYFAVFLVFLFWSGLGFELVWWVLERVSFRWE